MNERKASHLNHADLWEKWKEQGDLDAKKSLIEKYLHIVNYVSGRLAVGLPKNVPKDDLESNGVMGLIDALEKFDYERGLQFETSHPGGCAVQSLMVCVREIGFLVPCGRKRSGLKMLTSN